MARRFQFVQTPMSDTSQLIDAAAASRTEEIARAGQGCKIVMLDTELQASLAPRKIWPIWQADSGGSESDPATSR